MNRQVSIRKNYLYNSSYQILLIIAPLITTPYVSRVLGGDGIGIYSYVNSIVTYFVLFGNIGMATYGEIEISKVRDNAETVSKLFTELILTRGLTLGISLLLYTLVIFFHRADPGIYTIFALNLIAAIFDITWFYQGMEDFGRIVKRNFCIKLASIVLIFCCVKTKDDLYKYALILQGSMVLGNMSLWIYLKQYSIRIKLKAFSMKRHLKESIIYFIPTIAISIYTVLDKTMIGIITKSPFENGYYEQAYKIQTISITIITAMNTVMQPRMAFLFAKQQVEEIKERLNQSAKFTLFLAIPMTLGLYGISESLVPWFLGTGFEKVTVLLKIFSLLIIIIGISNFIGFQYLVPGGLRSKNNKALCLGAGVNFILNLFLIPRFSAVGAALASVFAELVITCFFLYYGRKFVRVLDLVLYGWKYLLAASIMLVVVVNIGTCLGAAIYCTFVQIAVGSMVYIIMLLILRDSFVVSSMDRIWENIRI